MGKHAAKYSELTSEQHSRVYGAVNQLRKQGVSEKVALETFDHLKQSPGDAKNYLYGYGQKPQGRHAALNEIQFDGTTEGVRPINSIKEMKK